MKSDSVIQNLFNSLPEITLLHKRTTATYAFYEEILKEEIRKLFSSFSPQAVSFGSFGEIIFPYYKMGAIDSLDLFGLDELIIFSFYQAHKKKYKNVVDIGANIGLHSIILCKCGYNVRSFEPDPVHYKLLSRNLEVNKCTTAEVFQQAVSKAEGKAEFIRVKGNTTGSHLAGSKANPYGDLDKFEVDIVPIRPLLAWADLVKLDAEGHEKEILLATEASDWAKTDAIVEIGSQKNANAIFEHFRGMNINIFTQKNCWKKALNAEDLPTSHREGSAFISHEDFMNW